VGKTELLRQVANQHAGKVLWLEGEDLDTVELLAHRTKFAYNRWIGNHTMLVIDEAQHVPNIGLSLKFIVDQFPAVKLMVTGSSQFDLSNKLGDPLTGRSKTLYLYPIAQCELKQVETSLQTQCNLGLRLVYGSYPELWRYETVFEMAAIRW
jgi:predicted AAA+ superfamily ATPase